MNYTQAPLPFTGQKRRFLNHFKTLLKQHIPNDGEGWTIVDAFGGSGLLAHTAKQVLPKARVIYNDFDGYTERLKNINDTNKLRTIIADLLAHYPRSKKLPENLKKTVQAALNSFGGYIDLDCVASWILFSGRQTTDLHDLIHNHTYYNCVRLSDYPDATGYLKGVEVVSKSYHELLPEFQNNPKALLVLDPPYICTAQGAYRNDTYFGMVQFLRLMRLVRPPFVFFSSTRSELLDYLDFVIDDKAEGWQNLKDYQKISVNVVMNKTAQYEDNMVYKFQAA